MDVIFFVLMTVFIILWHKEAQKRKAAEKACNDLIGQLQDRIMDNERLASELSDANARISALAQYEKNAGAGAENTAAKEMTP